MHDLFYSYFGISSFNGLKISKGIELLNYAVKKREEDTLWQYWLAKFPYHDEDEKTFEQLKQKVKGLEKHKTTRISTKAIVADIEAAMIRMEDSK